MLVCEPYSTTNPSRPMNFAPVALILLAAAFASTVTADEPRYFGASKGGLVKAKMRLRAHDGSLLPAFGALVKSADAALKVPPPSVTQKTKLAPSGDRHDYLSTAPYYWPDPSKPGGLPYLRRDGKVNPESRTAASDQMRLEELGRSVETLALAYWFTGREDYAAHAAKFLRVWFLDPATRMNPHFNYAQGVPGSSEGRPAGMIEAGGLIEAADASDLLAGSPAWSPTDETALRKWCGEFLDWMRTSKLGRAVSSGDNNQATMSDVRAVRFAFKAGRDDVAREILSAVGNKRIAVQIAPDGSQPHELSRTKSFSYSRLNLAGLVTLATFGERFGLDLWNFSTADGRCLRKAIDYMAPYAKTPPAPWPQEQIASLDRSGLAGIFRQAALAYHDAGYAQIVAQLPGTELARFQLTHPLP